MFMDVFSAQVPEMFTVFDDMKDGLGQAMCDGDNGPFGATFGFEPIILFFVKRTVGSDGSPRYFDHCGLEVVLGYRSLAAFTFSGTFIVAGAKACPGTEVGIFQKGIQVGPHFRQNRLGGYAIDAGNLIEAINQILMRRHEFIQALADGNDGFLYLGNVSKKQIELKPMVIFPETLDSPKQFRGLGFDFPMQTGLDLVQGDRFKGLKQKVHQCVTTFAKQVRQDRIDLDICRCQDFLCPSFEVVLGVHLFFSKSAQIPPLTDMLFRDEAAFQQTMPQQTGQPLRVTDVGFATRDILYMTSIDQYDFESLFQNIIGTVPIDTGRFHGNDGTLMLDQPVSHTVQIVRECAELSDFHFGFPVRTCSGQSCGNLVLVDVHRTANGVHNLDYFFRMFTSHDCPPFDLRLSVHKEDNSGSFFFHGFVIRNPLFMTENNVNKFTFPKTDCRSRLVIFSLFVVLA